jgi:hypothetical protein
MGSFDRPNLPDGFLFVNHPLDEKDLAHVFKAGTKPRFAICDGRELKSNPNAKFHGAAAFIAGDNNDMLFGSTSDNACPICLQKVPLVAAGVRMSPLGER